MFDEFSEVKDALKYDRFEIVIKDQKIESLTEEADRAQKKVFENISQLNFLSLTSCSLSNLSSSIKNCQNLISLVLPANQLTSLPDVFENFPKLKFIDVSHNEIDQLPASVSKLEKLESLIVANNKLTADGFPDLSNLVSLHVFDASHNSLKSFPPTLTHQNLAAKFHTIDLSNNSIEEIPNKVQILQQLKDVKLNNNSLKNVPTVLSMLPKLKTLDISENAFKDTRFRKLANDKRAKVSAVIAYIVKNGKALGDEKTEEKEDKMEKEEEEGVKKEKDSIVVRTGIENLSVRRHPSVVPIRPYLVCAVFNNIDLQNGDSFKKFIALQTRLHSSPLCDNRGLSAIGTHRLDAMKLPICYMALPKSDLHIRALNKKSTVTATELLDSLLRDAELARKRSKRSTVDPLHRYLHIVRDDDILACLVDAQQCVISLPPITNSDSTKLTVETTSIWVEVSSKQSLEACKKTMDELVMESRLIFPDLSIDQVRVVDDEKLVSIYPDKNDLSMISIERIAQ